MIVLERDIHPSVLTIRMDRPEKRNALNAELAARLTDAVRDADSDRGIRTVVLTGSGKAFSAGADLAALERLRAASFEDNLADSRTLAVLFEAIYECTKPVVARVNGHAIAGGCGLAAVCDFVVAVEGARLGFTEVRIGFVPAIISVYLLERYPESVVRRDFLTGALFTAMEAKQKGLVTHVAAPEMLDEVVFNLVQELTRNTSGQAVASTKAMLRERHAGRHQAALDAAIERNARARGEVDCRAGVDAFLNKTAFPWVEDWDAKK